MNRTGRVLILAEAGVMIALAWLLSLVKLFTMPYGGSVTLGSMIPIVLLAVRRGPGVGAAAGAALGFLRYALKPSGIAHPIQFLMDYPVAFGLLGLAGLAAATPWLAGVLGIGGRFLSHWIGGAVFFGAFAPEGMNPWIYSGLYNGAYLGVEIVIAAVVLSLLPQRLLRPGGGHKLSPAP